MTPAHHKVSMYVWRTHTPFPFMPWLRISALGTAAVPTATGVLQKKKECTLLECFPLGIFFFFFNHKYVSSKPPTPATRYPGFAVSDSFVSKVFSVGVLSPAGGNAASPNSFGPGACLWHTYCPPLQLRSNLPVSCQGGRKKAARHLATWDLGGEKQKCFVSISPWAHVATATWTTTKKKTNMSLPAPPTNFCTTRGHVLSLGRRSG